MCAVCVTNAVMEDDYDTIMYAWQMTLPVSQHISSSIFASGSDVPQVYYSGLALE